MSAFDLTINFIEAFSFILFIYLALNKTKGYLSFVIAVLLYAINTIIHNNYYLPEISLTFTSILILFLYVMHINRFQITHNLFLVLCSHIILELTCTLSMIITYIFYGFPFYSGDSYICLAITAKLSFLVIIFIVSHYFRKYHFVEFNNLIYIFMALLFLDLLYSILIDRVFYEEIFHFDDIMSFTVLNLLSSCLCIIFFQSQNKHKIILELQKNQLKLENEENIQKINQENMNEMRKWKHEIQHVFSAIDYQLMNQDIHQARKIISQHQNILHQQQFIVSSGNDLLDYFISQKNQEIINKHISLSIDDKSKTCPLSDIHFMIIVGNLLNNAIENCNSDYLKNIGLYIENKTNYYCMKVTNSTKE